MSERKGILLRLDPAVHDALARWAADELRSTNAQIEFLLRRALADAGRLPREAAAGMDRRMRTVDDKVRSAMESAWRRTTPESSPLLAQMREQVAEAEQRLARDIEPRVVALGFDHRDVVEPHEPAAVAVWVRGLVVALVVGGGCTHRSHA